MSEEKKVLFQVPGYLFKASTVGAGLRIVMDTQENLSADAISRFFVLAQSKKPGWLTYSSHEIDPKDVMNLPPIVPTGKKTLSQRQREVLFRIWEQNDQGFEVFDDYHASYMDQAIARLKERLT